MLGDRILALDGMRGILALSIIIFHYSNEPNVDPYGYTSNFLFDSSFVAVDFFFVLSGFVIAKNYIQMSSSEALKAFLIKRWIRLYPMLFVSVVSYIPLKLYALNSGFEFNTGKGNYLDLLLEFLDPILLLNSFPILGQDAGLNPVSWSISAEMFSYFVFGLVVLVAQKWTRRVFWLMSITLYLFFIWHGRLEETSDLGFLRGLMGFSLGVVASDLNLVRAKIWSNLGIPLTLLATFVLYLYDQSLSNFYLMIMPIIFLVSVVVVSQSQNGFISFLKSKTPLFLGKISYSIYLNHYLIIWIIYFFMRVVLKLEYTPFNVWFGFFMVFILTILYSYFTNRFVEIEMSKWLKRRLLF